uniref:Fibrinogen C-terminal domain-containing protein n=1 Tax=Ciona savignyi TaxID=51511 RepID=H2ZKZ7_CIOSA
STSQKGEVGWPGKRGHAGSPGPKGEVGAVGPKGEPGQQSDLWRESFLILQRDVSQLKYVLRTDCKVALHAGNNESGIYNIIRNGSIFQVFCDMNTDEGGWTVFQRRINGEQDFFLNWDEYRRGFSNISKEFWMGLDDLHSLTSYGNFELRIDFTDCENQRHYAKYRSFKVLGASTNYQLQVAGFQGSPGMRDSLSYHNGPFSTKDHYHDSYLLINCATSYEGAWWFGTCLHSNLNGHYRPCVDTHTSMFWYNGTESIGLRFSEMKIRPY